ncbi:hypothetical protein STEG23_008755 [Scotinomys teguina]
MLKFRPRESVAVGEIRIIEKKSSTTNKDNWKDTMRPFQKTPTHHRFTDVNGDTNAALRREHTAPYSRSSCNYFPRIHFLADQALSNFCKKPGYCSCWQSGYSSQLLLQHNAYHACCYAPHSDNNELTL